LNIKSTVGRGKMVAHAILFIVLPLAFAWLVGVTACLPPYSLPPTRKPEREIEPEFEEEVGAFLAQHGRRDAASARRMVPGAPGHALVDRAASAEGLAMRDMPPAGSPDG
jgi:hypothetical protein